MAGTVGVNSTQIASVSQTVQQYMQLEQARMQELQSDKAEMQVQGQTYTELGTRLRSLRTVADDFRWPGSLNAINEFTAGTSNESVLDVTITGATSDGSHTVIVSQLATAHSMITNGYDGDEAVDGSLVGESVFSITMGEESVEVSVSIEADDTNQEALRKVVLAINETNSETTALLVMTDSTTNSYQVLLSSENTGTTNLISSVTDVSGSLAGAIGLAGSSTAEGYSANTVQSAVDAEFTMDGLAFVSDTNQVTGAVSGMTLNLVSTSESAITVSVERDTETVVERIQELLDAFNDVSSYVRGETAGADEDGEGRGAFAGDSMFMSLRSNLRSTLTGNVIGMPEGNSYQRLSEIGITADRYGTLTISNSTLLEASLEANPTHVEELFSLADEGIANRIEEFTNSYVKAGGLISQRNELMNSRQRTLDRQIEQETAYLQIREEELTEQFGNLQMVLANLNNQMQYAQALQGVVPQ